MTLISQYAQVAYVYVDEKLAADITIGTQPSDTICIDMDFFIKIQNGFTYWQQMFPSGPVYKNEKGGECLIETIFYLVNCIQELNPDPRYLDHWGRFKYISSLQYHYGIIEDNLVGTLMDTLISQYPILNKNRGLPRYPSKFMISHDIDLLHCGWKVEGYLALASWNIPLVFRVLKDKFLGKPFYNNIEEVLRIDESYGVKACYYLLAKAGKDDLGIMNADYSIDDLRKVGELVQTRGHTVGIHKSSFKSTFEEESKAFPSKVEHNRYHFLKFQAHKAWKEIETEGLKTDASLGFAEHTGFRNSYGLPFTPFDMENDRPFSFVEIPLHVMDVTLTKYLQLNTDKSYEQMKSYFINNKYNCIHSVLWHNDSFVHYHPISKSVFIQFLDFVSKHSSDHLLPQAIYENYIINFE
jgi:hypothetical protein